MKKKRQKITIWNSTRDKMKIYSQEKLWKNYRKIKNKENNLKEEKMLLGKKR